MCPNCSGVLAVGAQSGFVVSILEGPIRRLESVASAGAVEVGSCGPRLVLLILPRECEEKYT